MKPLPGGLLQKHLLRIVKDMFNFLKLYYIGEISGDRFMIRVVLYNCQLAFRQHLRCDQNILEQNFLLREQ